LISAAIEMILTSRPPKVVAHHPQSNRSWLGTHPQKSAMWCFWNNVRLRAGPTPDLFVVSGGKGVRMSVFLEGTKEFRAVSGDVDIKGTIRQLPALQIP
jgi:hypothetical protein